MINYYVVLEIPDFSDLPAIKKAYRTLSKKYHPDVNTDAFATDYFQKINEAYSFLTDHNKRMMLHQYLQATKHATKTPSQQKPQQTQTKKKPFATATPFIHFFSVDKKSFRVNDRVLLQWNVSQCKAVSINFIGNVSFSGTHYLKIDHFVETLEVLMTVVGLNDQIYKYRIVLKYDDSNEAEWAFHKIKTEFHDVDEIHFLKERFFGMHARIGKNEFKNRMLLLAIITLVLIILLLFSSANFFVFLLLLPVFWIIFSQCYKRMHDTKEYKYKVWQLFVPVYNVFIVAQLFHIKSETVANKFGVPPKQTAGTFTDWMHELLKKVNIWQKLSFGCFALLLLALSFKTVKNYDEIVVNLTSYYIEASRPDANGNVKRSYYVVFNDKLPVQVAEQDYIEIIKKKKYDTYKIALNDNNELEYIHLIDSKNNKSNQIKFGVFQSSNPLLLVVLMLFLSQLYVSQNLTAPKELGFANGYMVLCLLVYIYAIYAAIF